MTSIEEVLEDNDWYGIGTGTSTCLVRVNNKRLKITVEMQGSEENWNDWFARQYSRE